jgi:hypothetical protein
VTSKPTPKHSWGWAYCRLRPTQVRLMAHPGSSGWAIAVSRPGLTHSVGESVIEGRAAVAAGTVSGGGWPTPAVRLDTYVGHPPPETLPTHPTTTHATGPPSRPNNTHPEPARRRTPSTNTSDLKRPHATNRQQPNANGHQHGHENDENGHSRRHRRVLCPEINAMPKASALALSRLDMDQRCRKRREAAARRFRPAISGYWLRPARWNRNWNRDCSGLRLGRSARRSAAAG